MVCYLLNEQPSIYVIHLRCLNYILHSNQLVPQSHSACYLREIISEVPYCLFIRPAYLYYVAWVNRLMSHLVGFLTLYKDIHLLIGVKMFTITFNNFNSIIVVFSVLCLMDYSQWWKKLVSVLYDESLILHCIGDLSKTLCNLTPVCTIGIFHAPGMEPSVNYRYKNSGLVRL